MTTNIMQILLEINQKTNINFYDLNGAAGHFHHWCNKRGYVKTDIEGKDSSSSQIWFAEYRTAADGKITKPIDFSLIKLIEEIYPYDENETFTLDVNEIKEKTENQKAITFLEAMEKEYGQTFTTFFPSN